MARKALLGGRDHVVGARDVAPATDEIHLRELRQIRDLARAHLLEAAGRQAWTGSEAACNVLVRVCGEIDKTSARVGDVRKFAGGVRIQWAPYPDAARYVYDGEDGDDTAEA